MLDAAGVSEPRDKGYAKVDGIMYHHVYDVDDDDHQWIKWRTTLGSMRAGKWGAPASSMSGRRGPRGDGPPPLAPARRSTVILLVAFMILLPSSTLEREGRGAEGGTG